MDENIGNPFEKINNIETSQELLDIAFEKSLKTNISSRTRSAIERSRNHELNRINTAANVIVDRIERIISTIPHDRKYPSILSRNGRFILWNR